MLPIADRPIRRFPRRGGWLFSPSSDRRAGGKSVRRDGFGFRVSANRADAPRTIRAACRPSRRATEFVGDTAGGVCQAPFPKASLIRDRGIGQLAALPRG